jgi:hypothetical protein
MLSVAILSPIFKDRSLAMFCLKTLVRVFRPVKAVEPGIAVFAPKGVQEDKSEQWFEGNPVRTPHRIIALTFWAIWHHGSSVPRAVSLR